jgi:hypothetical protein
MANRPVRVARLPKDNRGGLVPLVTLGGGGHFAFWGGTGRRPRLRAADRPLKTRGKRERRAAGGGGLAGDALAVIG